MNEADIKSALDAELAKLEPAIQRKTEIQVRPHGTNMEFVVVTATVAWVRVKQ